MRRFKPRVLLLAVTIAVVFAFPLLAPTVHRIDQVHFDLIQVGMTRADVEAILGASPGQYDWAKSDSQTHLLRVLAAVRLEEATILERAAAAATLEHTTALRRHLLAEARAFYSFADLAETWVSRHGAFTVQFDRDDRVVSTTGGGSVKIVPPWQRWWKAISMR